MFQIAIRHWIAKAVIGLPEGMESPTSGVQRDLGEVEQTSVLDRFFQTLRASERSCLLLDFDGTLAPFRVDPSRVRPWAGVVPLLEEIQCTGLTRIVVITGRPAQDVALQLDLRERPEIWGLHGAERLYCDGHLELQELSVDAHTALEAARAAIRTARLGVRIEEKWNAVVVHWRGLSFHARQAAESHALRLLGPYVREAGLELLQFDGGLELRAGPDKGDAVRSILAEISADAPVAYLGDDATDEHAFLALQGRGLGVLVRREYRPGAAQAWLRPPAELRSFLTAWLKALQR